MSDPVEGADADELPDDDPDVLQGMERLRQLRETEDQTPEL